LIFRFSKCDYIARRVPTYILLHDGRIAKNNLAAGKRKKVIEPPPPAPPTSWEPRDLEMRKNIKISISHTYTRFLYEKVFWSERLRCLYGIVIFLREFYSEDTSSYLYCRSIEFRPLVRRPIIHAKYKRRIFIYTVTLYTARNNFLLKPANVVRQKKI